MDTGRKWHMFKAALLASSLGFFPTPAMATDQMATIAALQRQIDELRAQVEELRAARATPPANPAQPAEPAIASQSAQPAAPPAAPPATALPPAPAQAKRPVPGKAWHEKLQLRGYTQLRVNEVIAGQTDLPAGLSRPRSVMDAGVGEQGNFSIRRARLVVQGDVSERMSLYLQSDFASAVSNQSSGERRENFAQLRDAYADLHFANRQVKLRLGQSKVPYGWENLQSSSNRLTLDRAEAANSAVPGERDLGVVAYYTPPAVQKIWDELAADGQKLFGSYGAFGFGLFNGQGTNRTEKNDGLMKVALATLPIRLDGLGAAFDGQVLELGAQGMLNTIQPELRSGGVSQTAFKEKRVNLHAVLYPNPLGFQAEWNWGQGPEWRSQTQSIASAPLSGGYVQTMYRIKHSPIGVLMPYARWQRYRGGWKGAANAPRLDSEELELGIEWQPLREVELTLAYASMNRAEADERRTGRAAADLIRAQVQWIY